MTRDGACHIARCMKRKHSSILVTTGSPARNFLQLDFLDLLTCNIAAIGSEDSSRQWSIIIPSHPTNGRVVTLKTGSWEVPDSNPDRTCRSSRSEISVDFSETLVNKGLEFFRKTPYRGHLPLLRHRSLAQTTVFNTTVNPIFF